MAYQPLSVILCQIHFIQRNSSISNYSVKDKYTVQSSIFFQFQAIQFSLIFIFQIIQLSMSIVLAQTQLNVKTVLFQTIQFNISTVSISKAVPFQKTLA